MTDIQPWPLVPPLRGRVCRYASSSTRLPTNRMRNSAPVHSNSSRDVVRTCVRTPVSGSVFMETAVRVLLCSGSDFVKLIATSLPAQARLINVHVSEART
jgi:hypothetical protein